MTVRTFFLIQMTALSISINSCTGQKSCTKCGIIVSKMKFMTPSQYEYTSVPTYGKDQKIWYKDSMVIEEIKYLYIRQVNNDQEERKEVVDHYTFIQLPTRSFYNYATLTDTAKILKKYTQPDSEAVFSGWNFYRYWDTQISEPLQNLPDTTINKIIYKRVKMINTINSEKGKWRHIKIGYFRCDKRGTIFQYDKRLSEKIGCPMVMYHDLPDPHNKYSSLYQIEFVTDTLTPEELKVFAAWERNAKRNPVK